MATRRAAGDDDPEPKAAALSSCSACGVKHWQYASDQRRGTAPLRPLVSIGSGVSELVLAPVQTYRNHGLVLRGLRHGSNIFARNLFVEGMSLASQILLFSQAALETLAAAREGSWPEA